MHLKPETLRMLLRIYAQTLGLSLLFVGAGEFLHRRLLAGGGAPDDGGPGWVLGRGYFLGLSVFLLLFVLVSRVVGARFGLWITLALLLGAALAGIASAGLRSLAPRRLLPALAVLLVLVVVYSVTNATCWLEWDDTAASESPGTLTHFGSIHSGRYANYAIFILRENRIPFLAQNAGQSLLASAHLLLGADAPLVALMAWIPVSLAFLTLLCFGLFRAGGGSVASSAAATFLVLFCNVAVSLVHVLLFDNGSPLAFIGYTDLIVSVATFLLLCRWVQEELLATETAAGSPARFALPALLGVTWCWYAPHDVAIAVACCAATTLVWWWRYPGEGARPWRRLGIAGVVFALGVGVGATQLGSFLPASLRENVGAVEFVVGGKIRIRPYLQYLTSHWTVGRWNLQVEPGSSILNHPDVYENAFKRAAEFGRDDAYRAVLWLFEQQLWDSIRIYGFPLLGLLLLHLALRRERDRTRLDQHAWLLLSLFAFAVGYGVAFGLDLDGRKWWLARFLVPGSAMALTCLGYAVLDTLRARSRLRILLVGLLLVAATVGPVSELGSVFFRNFVAAAKVDPLGRRLDLMVETKGPF